MEILHIVITWDAYGHIESDYVEISYSGSTSEIDQYVQCCYGKESGQHWRVATPADKEVNTFSKATSLSNNLF